MKRIGFSTAIALSVALSGLVGCRQAAPPAAQAPAPTPESPISRGKFLVQQGVCNDCHTPLKMGANGVPEPDMTRMLSGHPEDLKMPDPPKPVGPWIASIAATSTAFAGPWGISYAINLTPDQNTGLGIWTEDMFVKAMKTGKHFGTSRPIMPPMPWHAYAMLSDEDLKAMYAYLKSVPPIVNHVPDSVEAPPPPAAAPKK